MPRHDPHQEAHRDAPPERSRPARPGGTGACARSQALMARAAVLHDAASLLLAEARAVLSRCVEARIAAEHALHATRRAQEGPAGPSPNPDARPRQASPWPPPEAGGGARRSDPRPPRPNPHRDAPSGP